MTVTDVTRDPENLTLTLRSQFDAGVDAVWQLWADPRLLERWWGPPTYPATMVDHDLRPGGAVNYYMTGPQGDKHHGWWRFTSVDAPHGLEFDDGFADDSGEPDPRMPSMTVRVRIAAASGGGTEMVVTTTFPDAAAMEQLLAMGMQEGMTAAVSQMDALLAG
jgi:uncharacterized protein YndB with AHSA1/START domain